jgi:hypothetical protein
MAAHPDELHAHRDELIARIDVLNEAIARAASVMDAARESNRQFRDSVAAGRPLKEAFAAVAAPESMVSAAKELKRVERLRHEARTAAFTLGLAEDLSIGELGRLYGFSRQLAQRFAREARDQAAGEGAGAGSP